MRAISLWQPWASAIPLRLKRYETRHWATKYRGPLAIHAARQFRSAERDFAAVEHGLGRLPARLPLGAVVAICTLQDCLPTFEVLPTIGAIEKMYGNYGPGRFAWLLTDVIPLKEPVPYIGRQSFFDVPDELIRAQVPESA